MPDTRLTDSALHGLLDSFPGSLLAFGEAYHDAVLELLAARATIAELKRFAIQCAHMQSDVVTGTSVANDVLSIIDHTAKGK